MITALAVLLLAVALASDGADAEPELRDVGAHQVRDLARVCRAKGPDWHSIRQGIDSNTRR